jgi:hypothetical protein
MRPLCAELDCRIDRFGFVQHHRRMKKLAIVLLLMTGSCNATERQAKQIVAEKLGNPEYIECRRVKVKGNEVCGEVDASDKPGGGFRPFVAYTKLKDAAIMPPGELTSEAEMGNPLLKGAAYGFVHQCD